MRQAMSIVARLGGTALLALSLGGCAYDYLQHTDRVTFRGGNAVKANLEAQTTNPSDAARYNTKGLGKDGVVVPPDVTPAPAVSP